MHMSSSEIRNSKILMQQTNDDTKKKLSELIEEVDADMDRKRQDNVPTN